MKKWSASAPANIALIKYMGKVDANKNLPLNPSLSYTLENFRTFVEVELTPDQHDSWQLLTHHKQLHPMNLSHQGQQRYLDHLTRIKNHFNCDENFIIKSANNFPSDCGLASSASSYAALTIAACQALTELTGKPALTMAAMATLSQQASGSSCRSFYSPWCLWHDNVVEPVELPFINLSHQVIMVDKNKKMISSSKAHELVQSSALYQGRAERAEQRLNALIKALLDEDWKLAFEITWQEFWDMHALFETAHTPFGYMTPESLKILNLVRTYWQEHAHGPLATMDAGPNIHLLFQNDQTQHNFQKILLKNS